MQGFSEVRGQSGAVEVLKSTLESGRIAHAYLFSGPRGVGKGLTARCFARGLNCEAESARPCNRCLPCQKALNGNHPDIMYLQPDGNSLKIEQVRRLQKGVFNRAFEGKYKVFVLEDAHKATIQAANSLLKVLEEPPEGCVFILITENAQALPATVLSRCQRVNFAPLDKEVMRELLFTQGYSPEEAEVAINLAQGSMGQALELMGNPKLSLARQSALDFIEGAFAKNYFRRYKVIESLDKEKIDSQLFVDQLISLLRDLFLLNSGAGEKIANADLTYTLQAVSVTRDMVKTALAQVLEAGEFQRKQANTKLLFDVLGNRLARLV